MIPSCSRGWILYFYTNHIFCDIKINGVPVVSSGNQEALCPGVCAQKWDYFVSPSITPEDTVEIQLSNPHRFANETAYREFLSNLYPGSDLHARTTLQNTLSREHFPLRSVTVLILIFSIGLLGIAVVFTLARFPLAKLLWEMGLFSFGMSGYLLLGATDISLWIKMYAFNTYGQFLCIMLSLFSLGLYVSETLTSRCRNAARAVILAEEAFLAGLLLCCLCGRVLIYDTLFFWCAAQVVFCAALLGCCLYELYQLRRKTPLLLCSSALMLCALLLDLTSAFFRWVPGRLLTEYLFYLLFFLHVIGGIRGIPSIYLKAIHSDQLKDDLKNARIVMAMNQIRTHFIFNVLNAISGMCKYDPEKADKTVVRFARYLRTNIDIMQDDQPVTFHSDLRHLEDYVALEQIRFGDKIQFVTDIEVDHFLLPPLILQPIVENAIKHGLTPKPSGGTVTLRTREENGAIRISIEDDGMGFDPDVAPPEGSVGLQNVKSRLKHIMNGTLDVRSAPGQGAAVTIIIPQEDTELCT